MKGIKVNSRKLGLFACFVALFLSSFLGQLGFIVTFFCVFVGLMVVQVWFSASNKRRLVLFSLETGELQERFIGRILGVPVPSKPLHLRRNFFADDMELSFTGINAWEYIISYRDRYQIANDCLIGSIEQRLDSGKKVDGKFEFKALVTSHTFKEIFSSKEVLKYVTNSMNRETDDRIKQFDSATKSMMELSDRIEEIKDKIVILMRRINSGTQDFTVLVQEVFGLHPDELNRIAAQQMIDKAKQRDELLKMVKEGKVKPELLPSLLDGSTQGGGTS